MNWRRDDGQASTALLAMFTFLIIVVAVLANPRVVAMIVSILPLAVCSALGLGCLWRVCERLLADHRQL